MVAGLLQPTSGTIRVCGNDVIRDPKSAKQKLGFIGDRPFVYDKLTGSEFLRFVGGLWGMTGKAIADEGQRWLERFGLESWSGEAVESYSHGMRQRLLLCATLMHSPELLILDEPLVGLDPRGAVELKQVVRELADAANTAVVLSTHTLDVVEQVCDRLVVIDRGQIVAHGTLDEVHQLHQSERLEELFLKITSNTAADDSERLHAGE
jgi:ABC-2 type transport system ATP-binding protein